MAIHFVPPRLILFTLILLNGKIEVVPKMEAEESRVTPNAGKQLPAGPIVRVDGLTSAGGDGDRPRSPTQEVYIITNMAAFTMDVRTSKLDLQLCLKNHPSRSTSR